jgi:hypothetical protein
MRIAGGFREDLALSAFDQAIDAGNQSVRRIRDGSSVAGSRADDARATDGDRQGRRQSGRGDQRQRGNEAPPEERKTLLGVQHTGPLLSSDYIGPRGIRGKSNRSQHSTAARNALLSVSDPDQPLTVLGLHDAGETA